MAGDRNFSLRERPSGERLFVELMRIAAKLAERGEPELAELVEELAIDALLIDARLFLALDQVLNRAPYR
jgi:hypothetical protein